MMFLKNIVLEGLDGVGKTTIMNKLSEKHVKGIKFPTESLKDSFNFYTKNIENLINCNNIIIDNLEGNLYRELLNATISIINSIANYYELVTIRSIIDQSIKTIDENERKYRGKRFVIQDRGLLSPFIYAYCEYNYYHILSTILSSPNYQKNILDLDSAYKNLSNKKLMDCKTIFKDIIKEAEKTAIDSIERSSFNCIWLAFNSLLKHATNYLSIHDPKDFYYFILDLPYNVRKEIIGNETISYKKFFEEEGKQYRLTKYIELFKRTVSDYKTKNYDREDICIPAKNINFIDCFDLKNNRRYTPLEISVKIDKMMETEVKSEFVKETNND